MTRGVRKIHFDIKGDFIYKHVSLKHQTQVKSIDVCDEYLSAHAHYKPLHTIGCSSLECQWKHVLRVKFREAEEFIPGQAISIWASNPIEQANLLIEYLDIPDRFVQISREGPEEYIYKGFAHNFIHNYLDFTTIPKKAFFHNIMKYANSTQVSILSSICDQKCSESYFNLHRQKYNVFEILYNLGIRPDFEFLVENCSLIRPRSFSLINTIGMEMEVLIGIQETQIEDTYVTGHVSHFFRNSDWGSSGRLWYFLRPTTNFYLKPYEKYLFVGSGTGIAPFIAFSVNSSVKTWLLYGARNSIDNLSNMCNFWRTDLAYSSKGIYVTDIIRGLQEEIREYCEGNTGIYVCGSYTMQKDTFVALDHVLGRNIRFDRIYFDSWL